MKFPIILMYLSYALSLLQAHNQTMLDQTLYLIAITSNFVLFVVTYNFFRNQSYIDYGLKLFIGMNVLVVLYGVIQITVGFEQFALFGVQEFTFEQNLESKQRLIGAFGPAGVTGEYYAMQILLVGYLFIQPGPLPSKVFYILLMLADFGLLVGTGSRGSFLVLIGGILMFLWLFRREMGLLKIARNVTIGIGMFSIVAVAIVSLTNFNVLFERLENTQVDGGIPETRQVAFALGIEGFLEAPLLGHGPRLRLMDTAGRRLQGYKTIPYPHNLYLFLLYTVGFVGLAVHLIFFILLWNRFRRAAKFKIARPLVNGIPRLGTLILIVFLVDQLKIEYLRVALNDIQHYFFALWGILLAVSDNILSDARAAKLSRAVRLPTTR